MLYVAHGVGTPQGVLPALRFVLVLCRLRYGESRPLRRVHLLYRRARKPVCQSLYPFDARLEIARGEGRTAHRLSLFGRGAAARRNVRGGAVRAESALPRMGGRGLRTDGKRPAGETEGQAGKLYLRKPQVAFGGRGALRAAPVASLGADSGRLHAAGLFLRSRRAQLRARRQGGDSRYRCRRRDRCIGVGEMHR